MKLCSVEGCGRKHAAKGFCHKHYYRVKAHNGVLRRTMFDKNKIVPHDDYAIIELYDILGRKTSETVIDISDVELVSAHKWYLSKRGYPASRINRKLICLHKFITGFDRTDHIDGDTLNNRRANLRPATQQQNIWNQRATGGTSKYKGVYLEKRSGKWTVQCNRKFYGQYKNEDEAAIAYNKAAIKTFGEYARLNIVPNKNPDGTMKMVRV